MQTEAPAPPVPCAYKAPRKGSPIQEPKPRCAKPITWLYKYKSSLKAMDLKPSFIFIPSGQSRGFCLITFVSFSLQAEEPTLSTSEVKHYWGCACTHRKAEFLSTQHPQIQHSLRQDTEPPPAPAAWEHRPSRGTARPRAHRTHGRAWPRGAGRELPLLRVAPAAGTAKGTAGGDCGRAL